MFADRDGELRGITTADSLQRVLDHYAAADWRAQRVLVTGDLIHDDSEQAYTRFRDFLLPLRLRVHCVPGNHDVRALIGPDVPIVGTLDLHANVTERMVREATALSMSGGVESPRFRV